MRIGAHILCADCEERLSPIERTPATVWNVVTASAALLQRIALPALVLVVLGTLPIYLFRRFVWDVPALLEWAASVLLTGVMLHMSQRAIREQRVDLQQSARAAWHAWPRLLLVSFVAHLQLAGLALLCVIAVVAIAMSTGDTTLGAIAMWLCLLGGVGLVSWRAATLAVALPVSLHEQPSGSALRLSTLRMKKRLAAALVFAACGFLASMAPVLGWLAIALVDVANALGVRGIVAPGFHESSTVIEVASLLVANAFTMLSSAISAVLYAKTVKYRIY
jgi:hypothetical protein